MIEPMSDKEVEYWNSLDIPEFHVKSCLCDSCRIRRIRKRHGLNDMTASETERRKKELQSQINSLLKEDKKYDNKF